MLEIANDAPTFARKGYALRLSCRSDRLAVKG